MDKIICNARSCMHNMSGSCDAGVVRIEEFIRTHGGIPYCATLSLSGDSANTMRNFFKQQFWRADQRGEGGSLCCTMLRCTHNERGFCNAERIEILSPRPGESRFAICASYRKK